MGRRTGEGDSHIGRGAVTGTHAGNLIKDPLQQRERLHVPVVIDGDPMIGLKMERIDHVEVGQVNRDGLVGNVDRVSEGQTPDGNVSNFA